MIVSVENENSDSNKSIFPIVKGGILFNGRLNDKGIG